MAQVCLLPRSAKFPNFAVLCQKPPGFSFPFQYPVTDRMHNSSKSGNFEERLSPTTDVLKHFLITLFIDLFSFIESFVGQKTQQRRQIHILFSQTPTTAKV